MQTHTQTHDDQHPAARTQSGNPLALLVEIIKRMPDANERVHRATFIREMKMEENEDHLDAGLSKLYSLNYTSAIGIAFPPTPEEVKRAADQRRSERAQRAAAIEAAATENAERLIGDIEMPNGKKVRDCTGTEVGRFGGGFVKVAELVGERIVGEVLSEEALRELML